MSIKNVVEESKSIFVSKTFWLAVVQLCLAGVTFWLQILPNWASEILFVKSVLDVVLRVLTDKPVTL